MNHLILAYWRHAEKHYRGTDGKPTQELANIRDAIRPLRKLYGSTKTVDFGPLALRSIQQELIRADLCRTTINARINRIRRVFKWAVGVQLVPPSVHQAIQAVPGLLKGRTDARESEGIRPVAIEQVEATLPYLSRVVGTMVRLQLLMGCRAEEVMIMRGCDLTPGEPTWEYRPQRHKTAWRGQGTGHHPGAQGPGDRQGIPRARPPGLPFQPSRRGRGSPCKAGREAEVEAHAFGDRREVQDDAGPWSCRPL